jgi:aspartate-semialdehyde dehydrogenase
VVVAGASGLVGETLLRVLRERSFPASELRALRGRDAEPATCAGAELAFLALPDAQARALAPQLVAAGVMVVDLSGAWRLDPQVPLVVPEINAAALAGHRGLVASPNCTNVGFVLALAPLQRAAGLASVVVVTMQSASGAGRAGLEALEGGDGEVFPRVLSGNVVPQCEEFLAGGDTTEEVKLQAETRKILGLPGLPVTATCVRVPVAVGHSAAILVETERELSPGEAEQALAAQPGVILHRGADYPTPREIAGRDECFVGRVRRDPTHPRRLWLWQTADNLRSGAAVNAVKIAEALFARRP